MQLHRMVREAHLCLAGGGVLLYLTGVRPIGALAAWLYLVLLVRGARLERTWPGFVKASAVQAVSLFFLMRGVAPVPAAQHAVIVAVMGTVGGLILLADRVIAPRLPGWSPTLVLPCTAVSASFATSAASPFGTWGEQAYTQLGVLPLVQVVSVTGLWGLSFVMAWTASVANLVWERGWRGPGARPVAVAWVAATTSILLFGGVRLLVDARAPTLRVAAVTWDRAQPRAFATCDDRRLECLVQRTQAVNDRLFARSAAAAGAGARVILWSEGAAEVMAPAEAALIDQGRRFARAHGVTLVMALAVIPVEPGQWENKLVAVTAEGRVAWEYHKARVVPGEPIAAGPARVPVLDTPHGRIAAVICFDADFPDLVRQAGQRGADLLLVAANDWPRIARMHAEMAMFRAVENGTSLVRATSEGWSVAADQQGRLLAVSDHAAADPAYLLAELPMRRSPAPYAVWGDFVAWLCVSGLAVAALMALLRGRARPTAPSLARLRKTRDPVAAG
jgi:apolipoprotein N-acyltransferase